jgi:hypothetical protein
MNVGFQFVFPWGTEYYAFDTVNAGGKQYKGRITSATPFRYSMSVDGEYETSSITVEIEDKDGYLKGKLADQTINYIYGSAVTAYDEDANLLISKRVESGNYSRNTFTLVLSDRYSELNNPITDKLITGEEFPDAADANFKTNVNYFSGHFMLPSGLKKNLIKAPYVNKSATYKYLIGIPLSGAVPIEQKIYKPDFTDVSTTASIVWDATNGYAYVDYTTTTEEYLLVAAQYSVANSNIKDIIDEVSAELFSDYTLDASGVTTLLDNRHYYWPNVVGGTANYHRQPHYLINENMTGLEIAKDFCDSCGMEFYIDSSNNLVFHKIDYDNLTADETIETDKIISFVYSDFDTDRLFNKIIVNDNYNYVDNSYEKQTVYDKQESYDRYTNYKTKEINVKMSSHQFSGNSIYSFSQITAKYWMVENKDSAIIATIEMDLADMPTLNPTNLIEFSHEDALDNTTRLYIVNHIEVDYWNNKVVMTIRDITFMLSFRTEDRFLFQPDSEILNSEVYYDTAISGNVFMLSAAGGSGGNGVEHKQAVKKFLDSSARFDGDSTILTDPDWSGTTDAFDILTQTNFTLEGWIRHDVASGTTDEVHITNIDDANNAWVLSKPTDDKIYFQAISGGVANQLITTSTVTANTWHHIAVIKSGSNYGIYFDGAQEAYLNSMHSVTFDTYFVLGYWPPTNALVFTGYMALMRITHDNVFNGSPVVGLTDTITVPTNYTKDAGY